MLEVKGRARLRSLELVECEITEREMTLVLLQLRTLRELSVVNCSYVFMTGTFLSSEEERDEVARNLNQLRSLTLDDNKYLSDILLMRVTETTPNISSLRSVQHRDVNNPVYFMNSGLTECCLVYLGAT